MADKSIKDLSNKLRPKTIKACKVTGQKKRHNYKFSPKSDPIYKFMVMDMWGRVIYMEYAYIFMSKLRKKDQTTNTLDRNQVCLTLGV